MRNSGKFTVTLLLLCFLSAPARAGEGPEVIVREIPAAWNGLGIFPVRVDIRSPRAARATVTLSNPYSHDKYTVVRSVALPANAAVAVEMIGMVGTGSQLRVACEIGGVLFEESVHRGYQRISGDPDEAPLQLLCVNGFLFAEVQSRARPLDALHSSLGLDALPSDWRAYSALAGMMIVNPDDVARMTPGQREAISIWVKWLGGRVWLAGDGARDAAAALGLEPGPGEGGHRCRNGRVYLQDKPDADVLFANLPKGMPEDMYDSGSAYVNLVFPRNPFDHLLEDMGGISTGAIIACLALLGIVMGPVNYLYLRKRGNSLLFFLTTPLIALAGTIAIFAASLFSEGVGGRYREFACLVRAAESEEAMLLDARSVRPGFFTPGLEYPEDALVLPFWQGWRQGSYTVEAGNRTRLLAGWVNPRAVSGVMAAMPLASRLTIDIVKENGRWYAENNLGHAVITMAARLPDGTFGRADELRPGERKILKIERTGDHLKKLSRRVGVVDSPARPESVMLAASCAGLPYIEEWGLHGTRLGGDYRYMVLSRSGGEDGHE